MQYDITFETGMPENFSSTKTKIKLVKEQDGYNCHFKLDDQGISDLFLSNELIEFWAFYEMETSGYMWINLHHATDSEKTYSDGLWINNWSYKNNPEFRINFSHAFDWIFGRGEGWLAPQ